MTSQLNIKRITEDDVDTLYELMKSLAQYEGLEKFLTVSPEDLRISGFGKEPSWSGLFAYLDDKVIGYATYAYAFHMWSGTQRINLDDLFVSAEYRGHGAGEALMRAVFEIAQSQSMQVSWTVRPDNSKAIKFYKRLGANYSNIGKCTWSPEQ
ncbi:N-acetyltransferase family protein [Hyphococcus sp. DH-69]|uniref:GNAT family N-acetyltransferase n=1 Tax=Hyphococcus formosus TaxID=3143534 RepID=UPI00398AAD19